MSELRKHGSQMDDKIVNAIDTIKESTTDTYDKLSTATVQRAKKLDKTVHEHPWMSVGVAAATGAVVGAIFGSTRK